MKYKILLFFCSLVLVSIGTACSSDSPAPAAKEVKALKTPLVPDASLTAWIDAQGDVADRLTQMVTENAKDEENIVYSPLSFSMALSMLANGAEGEVASELYDILGVPENGLQEWNRCCHDIIDNFPYLDSKVDMRLVNGIWVDDSYLLRDSFVDITKDSYAANVAQVNYGTSNVKDIINEWVSLNTDGLLSNFLQWPLEGPLALVNALYFKGAWTKSFDEQQTAIVDFHLSEDSTIQVEMMHEPQMQASYSVVESRAVLTLPFGEGKFAMTLVLPKKGETSLECLNDISGSNLKNYMEDDEKILVDVSLPKFKMDTRLDITPYLAQLGYRKMFEESKWTNLGVSDELMMVGSILQQTVFSVDESGGEGASATAAVIVTLSGEPGEGKKPEFKADRPFVFVVKEKACSLPLFMGVVNKP